MPRPSIFSTVTPFVADEYVSLCLGGSAGRNDTSGMSLTQVDECALRPGICGGGRCIDTADGFVCECYTGYAKKKNVDVQVCEG